MRRWYVSLQNLTFPCLRGFTPFEHSHWRVPRADLYKVVATEVNRPDRTPKVFQLRAPQIVEQDLLSAMMPFAGFGGVYNAIQTAASNNQMRCHRADDIWENHAIIQDVVDLIDRSSIVVCDCTNRNPNVFYEIGVAHALGKGYPDHTKWRGRAIRPSAHPAY